ncbi:hypothetical protein NW759_17741 [Fusarium solani]|nr:hypothetical protein NW759_17741 [Fusarium solani]
MAFRITSYISPRYQVPTDSLLRSRSRSRLRSSLDGITTTPVEGRCALQANAMPCMGLGEPYSQCLQREPPRPSTAGTRRILDKPDHSSLASSSRSHPLLAFITIPDTWAKTTVNIGSVMTNSTLPAQRDDP